MTEKVVFDCMVYLQAVTNQHSPSRACFALAESGVIELQSSEMILDEIRQVLLRPTTLSRFPQLTQTMVDAFIAWVRSFSTIAFVVPKHMSYPRDPDDEPYLNLAIAAQASYIVSRDNDLLNLMQSQDEVSLCFRKQFPNIRILDVVSFIEVISKQHLSSQPSE